MTLQKKKKKAFWTCFRDCKKPPKLAVNNAVFDPPSPVYLNPCVDSNSAQCSYLLGSATSSSSQLRRDNCSSFDFIHRQTPFFPGHLYASFADKEKKKNKEKKEKSPQGRDKGRAATFSYEILQNQRQLLLYISLYTYRYMDICI